MILIQPMNAFGLYEHKWRTLSHDCSDYFGHSRNVSNERGHERSKRGSVQPLIRPFQPSDLDEVLGIEWVSFPDPWPELQFKFLYKRNPNGFLVAVLNGKIIGYVVAEIAIRLEPRKFRFKKRGHLLNIAVHKEFRRKGIGKALVESITSFLRKKRLEDVWLEVRASNSIARNFYLSVGFKEKSRKLRYYFHEDAIVMAKKL